DDGRAFENDYFGGRTFGSPFTKGQTVGCGYDPVSGSVYFTLEGILIGEATKSRSQRPYHAAVGADGRCTLRVNFGQRPFKYMAANISSK
ncbi:Rsp5p-dependent ubiquitination, sorting of cargo proteins at the multivesicular body, partial [Nowakowskiella sp. JEL0078]